MTDSLVKELKSAMKYTEVRPAKCKHCSFSKEVEGFNDRTFDRFCYFNSIRGFEVSDNGRCDKFKL